ncbi:SDR family oxidoreductase [Terrimonas pollutisoli]|uniref:SDR family oxidoreductase n=1 Tax=Terrimonas pollutisoli TaxID=3034147 RepID=UPI0023EB6770|nr:NAD(P)H-binding protein [Terrimonas sp. H1YJ31]
MKTVFITGATGYIGQRLIKQLLHRGHQVIGLVRKGSEQKLETGVKAVIADPFDSLSFESSIPKDSVFVQLLGVAHPSPAKAKQFEEIDLRSVIASVDAAVKAGVTHFIYVSVAMAPSRLMASCQQVRKNGEMYCKASGLNCTFIRPWYVVGPKHYWPVLLLPLYGIAEIVPAWRQKARGMALVTIHQMTRTLIAAVEAESLPLQVIDIKKIRHAR